MRVTSLNGSREREPLRVAPAARRWAACSIMAAVALATAGCAPTSTVAYDDAATYQCLSHIIDGEVLHAATPVGDLTGDAATMLAQARWDDGQALTLEDEDAWYVAAQSDHGILIMRTLPADEVGLHGPPNSDREILQVSRVEGSTNLADGWYVMANGHCPLTIDLGDLSVPTVELDPAHLPNPASAVLPLLVTESACNSGQSADGRVRLVSLLETEDSVTVTIGVEPQSTEATCPSNPPTPFTVELEAPLGDRTIIDGTRGAPLTAPPA